MNEIKCSRYHLCTALIGSEDYVSGIQNYIQDNFNELSATQAAQVFKSIQKNMLHQFKERWNRSGRKKEVFLINYASWLEEEYIVRFDEKESGPEPSTSTGKRGRPFLSYEASSDRTKKRKNLELFQECGLDFLHNSYVQGLRSIGESDEARIVQIIRSFSSEKKKEIYYNLLKESEPVIQYSKDEALSIYIDLDATKAQYKYLRNCLVDKKCMVFPMYKSISEAKQMCYPPQSSIEITDISAKVKLQNLLDHTVSRILMIDSAFKAGSKRLELYSKWGCDGSSGQSEYKQIVPGENDLISDSNLFVSSMVPIRLVNEETKEVLWQNPASSSVRFCRPIMIEFSKETPEKTKAVVDDIKGQISALSPSIINISNEIVEVKHELFFTMVDGKVAQVLTDTSSSAVCNVCGAKPKDMNDLEKVKVRPENKSSFQYGLSTLHAWIRFMEFILHISYNLNFQMWSAITEENKKSKTQKKQYVQRRFRQELGLIIDKPRQVSGNTNDGNTARRFFINHARSADITGVDEELIKRLYIILQVMSSGKAIDASKFGKYALETAQLHVTKYNWYYMPSSVHKVLIHGESIIQHFALVPLGQLSEDAQESRNKDYKNYRLHHARKCSRASTNEDVFHSLLYTSDPFISSLRIKYSKSTTEITHEAMQLLDLSVNI